MSKQFFIFVVAIGISSCTYFDKDEDKVLVTVHDKELYYSEIKDLISTELSAKDSVDYVSLLLENWAKDQLLIHQAKLNLTDDQQDFSKLVEEYENSLLIYTYKKELLAQKMDTAVLFQEIVDYYKSNVSIFRSNEDVARLHYIKLSNEIPNLDKLKKMITSKNEEDLEDLEEFCLQFAEEYHLKEEWVSIKELIKKLPDYQISAQSFRNRRFVSYKDIDFNYFIFFKEYVTEGSVSPIEIEEGQIKTIILNKRKIEFINDLEKDLYQTALAKDFVIYDEK
jgi:hypothetical protein